MIARRRVSTAPRSTYVKELCHCEYVDMGRAILKFLYFEDFGLEILNWSHLDKDWDSWRSVITTVMNSWRSMTLTQWANGGSVTH